MLPCLSIVLMEGLQGPLGMRWEGSLQIITPPFPIWCMTLHVYSTETNIHKVVALSHIGAREQWHFVDYLTQRLETRCKVACILYQTVTGGPMLSYVETLITSSSHSDIYLYQVGSHDWGCRYSCFLHCMCKTIVWASERPRESALFSAEIWYI